MNPALAAAEARAERNGMRIEVGDTDAGPVWPGMRYASVHLMRGREQVAAFTQSYRGSEARVRALSVCAERVYNRPA